MQWGAEDRILKAHTTKGQAKPMRGGVTAPHVIN